MSLGNLNVSTINNGAIGRKNLIINGDFQVNQRGVSSGHTASGANEYTLDRWKILTSGQSITWTGTYSKTVTVPAGGFTQIIEGLSIRTGTYVISWTGTATCTVDGISKSSGDTFTLTEGTNCTVTFSSGTVANVQVEQGDAASQFESRSYGEELALCQRYFLKLNTEGASTYAIIAGSGWTSAYTYLPYPFPVTMRSNPSVSSVGIISNIKVMNNATQTSATSIGLAGGTNKDNAEIEIGHSSITVGNSRWIRLTGGNSLDFDAEL